MKHIVCDLIYCEVDAIRFTLAKKCKSNIKNDIFHNIETKVYISIPLIGPAFRDELLLYWNE